MVWRKGGPQGLDPRPDARAYPAASAGRRKFPSRLLMAPTLLLLLMLPLSLLLLGVAVRLRLLLLSLLLNPSSSYTSSSYSS